LAEYFEGNRTQAVETITSDRQFKKVIWVDQKPIGRNSRSNPATYIKLFDRIRDLFAGLPAAKKLGLKKSHFSFNASGGRCEKCLGAGSIEIGLSYLGKLAETCDQCMGLRFSRQVLSIQYSGKNIAQVLDMEIDEALYFFSDQPRILPYIETLQLLGLGYIKLGQSSSTLSGGEAQRIKLVSELVKAKSKHCLYLFDEPSNGLHYHDISILLQGFDRLLEQENTLILVEHEPRIVELADWVVELGPEAGDLGGEIIFEGHPSDYRDSNSPMACIVNSLSAKPYSNWSSDQKATDKINSINLVGVRTNNLKNISLQIPHYKQSVITGKSGSGKTSLAFGTIVNRSNYLFTQTFSPYVRNVMGVRDTGDVESVRGLLPAIGIPYQQPTKAAHSTVGTLLGIQHLIRLLFSRFSVDSTGQSCPLWANQFSYLHPSGACANCNGLGEVKKTNESLLVGRTDLSISDGAMKQSRPGAFFSDPNGQYYAILRSMAVAHGIDYTKRWADFTPEEKAQILYGSKSEMYAVTWDYVRKGREGTHEFNSNWDGFVNLIESDYKKKEGSTREKNFGLIMEARPCSACGGLRIPSDRMRYLLFGKDYRYYQQTQIGELYSFFDSEQLGRNSDSGMTSALIRITQSLAIVVQLGLGYLSLNRASQTLSAGEYQRIRIAGQLNAGLSNMLYVIDEPETGLHPKNLIPLQHIFEQMIQQGNTLILTSHHPYFIQQSDYQIQLGPGAGSTGGEIIRQASVKTTPAQRMTGEKQHIATKSKRLSPLISLKGIQFRNLNIHELNIPIGWVSICGVSGSGKSSLMQEIIAPALDGWNKHDCEDIRIEDRDFNRLDLVHVRQLWLWSSTPLQVLGWDRIVRKEMNLKSGQIRCEHCKGAGYLTISLDYLGHSHLPCDVCTGTGYQAMALSHQLKGMNLFAIEQLNLEKVIDLLPTTHSIEWIKQLVQGLGLHYLQAGQHGNTLSNGEKRRLSLMKFLLDKKVSNGVFLFDEPTQGLDRESKTGYIKLMQELVKNGCAIISIDHDPELIDAADWIIELGPGGGYEGGRVIYSGLPSEKHKGDS